MELDMILIVLMETLDFLEIQQQGFLINDNFNFQFEIM